MLPDWEIETVSEAAGEDDAPASTMAGDEPAPIEPTEGPLTGTATGAQAPNDAEFAARATSLDEREASLAAREAAADRAAALAAADASLEDHVRAGRVLPAERAGLTAALADAAAEIDASIAQIWTLPLAATATYPLLAGLQCDLARARLYDEAVPDTVSAAATAARETLQRLCDGALALVAVNRLETATIEAALAAHVDAWLDLVARACARDAAWLARLGDADAHALSDAMWSANGSFFVRRVAQRAAARQGNGSRSPASSTPSSEPATAADTPTSRAG